MNAHKLLLLVFVLALVVGNSLGQYVQLADFTTDYSTTQVSGSNGWTYAFATTPGGSPITCEVYRANTCNGNTGWTTNAATCLVISPSFVHVSHTASCSFSIYHEAVIIWNSNVVASRYTSFQVTYSFTIGTGCGDGVNTKVITDGTTQANVNMFGQTLANTVTLGSLNQLLVRVNAINDCGCDGLLPFTVRVMGLPVMCYGISTFNTSHVCNGHGTCDATNTCNCAAGYVGPTCQLLQCNGVVPSNPIVCSGRGACLGMDSCACDAGYTGSFCQYPICSGVPGNIPTVCNSTGICRAPSYQLHFHKPYGYAAPYGVNTGPQPLFGAKNYDIFVTLMKTSATQGIIFSYDRNSEGNVQFRMVANADGSLTFESASVGATFSHGMNSAAVMSLNTWYTLQMARRGLAVTLYLNGTQIATGSSSQVYSMAETIANRPYFLVGARYVPGTSANQEWTFGGQILDLRIVADDVSLSPTCACTIVAGSCDPKCSGVCVGF